MLTLALLTQLALSQDSDGALERIQKLQASFDHRMSQLADAFEQVEADMGSPNVATLFVEEVVRSHNAGLEKALERISSLTEAEASDAFANVQKVYVEVGSPKLQRLARNVARQTSDSHERLRRVMRQNQATDVRTHFEKLLAQNDGVVSKMIRASVLQIRRPDLKIPFILTASWLIYLNGPQDDFAAKLFWSPFVIPFAVVGDLACFPFQAVYWIGFSFYWAGGAVGSLFTSTPDEERIARLETENRSLRNEVNELREKVGKSIDASQTSEPATIRR
jgi:hypothetical protein